MTIISSRQIDFGSPASDRLLVVEGGRAGLASTGGAAVNVGTPPTASANTGRLMMDTNGSLVVSNGTTWYPMTSTPERTHSFALYTFGAYSGGDTTALPITADVEEAPFSMTANTITVAATCTVFVHLFVPILITGATGSDYATFQVDLRVSGTTAARTAGTWRASAAVYQSLEIATLLSINSGQTITVAVTNAGPATSASFSVNAGDGGITLMTEG